jgi:hypothetical protein
MDTSTELFTAEVLSFLETFSDGKPQRLAPTERRVQRPTILRIVGLSDPAARAGSFTSGRPLGTLCQFTNW